MSFSLTDKYIKKRAEFRSFAEAEFDTGEHFPHSNLKKAAEQGYLGYPIPECWGGKGEDFLSYTLLIEEVSRVCASTGVILSVHTSVGTFPLLNFGTEAQKKRYLPGLAKGELIGAFALTEASAGSDAAALKTQARVVDGGYVLNGCKLFITGGGEADLYTVFATVDSSLGTKGITAFLVEKGSEGLTAGKPEKKMGLNRSQTTELRMDNLFVPLMNRLGDEGKGFSIAMSLLDGGRIGISAQSLGLTGAALDYTLGFLSKKQEEGQKVNQAKLFTLADLAARLEGARLLSYRAAVMKGLGKHCSKEASMAKLFATDLAMETSTKCIDLLGYDGMLDENPLSKYFCDSKAPQIYEGSNQIQRIVIARELFRNM